MLFKYSSYVILLIVIINHIFMKEMEPKAPLDDTENDAKKEELSSSEGNTSSPDESSQKKSNNKAVIMIIIAVVAVILIAGITLKAIKRSAGPSRYAPPVSQVVDDVSENDNTSLESLDTEIESAEQEESSLDDQLDELEALTF